jgi:hypothetical protein
LTGLILRFLLAPVAAYACYLGIAWLLDNFRGDGQIVYQYLSEPRRKLAWRLIEDFGAAMPVFFFVQILVIVCIWMVSRRLRRMTVIAIAALLGIAIVMLMSAVFAGVTLGTIVPPAGAGLTIGLLWAWQRQRGTANQ